MRKKKLKALVPATDYKNRSKIKIYISEHGYAMQNYAMQTTLQWSTLVKFSILLTVVQCYGLKKNHT